MHDQSAGRISGRTRTAVAAVNVRALRMTVLKSAGNFTRGECHDLSAEKARRVKLFVHAAQDLLRAGNFRNAGAVFPVRKFQALLRELLASRPLLRRADAPWGFAPDDPAVERLASLLAAHSATHVVVLAHDPSDLFVLAVPVMLADPASETALALVRRLLALTPESA